MSDNANTLWITGYAPTGHRISLTLAVNPDNLQADITRLIAAVAAAGVGANEPEAHDGKSEEIDAVVLRAYVGGDGKPKRVMDFYGRGKFKVASVYIDSEALAREFEAVSGLAIDKLPVHKLKSPLEREEAESLGVLAKFSQPAIALLDPNPDYKPDAATPLERGARYKFAGWQGAPVASQPGNPDAWSKVAQEEWWQAASQVAGMTKSIALSILGNVTKLPEWKGTKSEAFERLAQYKTDKEAEL